MKKILMLLCTTLLLSSAILAQKNVKEITFEGISLASAWDMYLKLSDKGYVEDGMETFNGISYTGYKGKFGPSKEDALVVIVSNSGENEVRSVMVIIENPKSTLKSIIIYLEKQFGHLELNKKIGCYEKHINNTSLSVNQEKNSKISLHYSYKNQNKNYKKNVSTSSHLAQKNVKEIKFEDISLANASDMCLKLKEKGYVYDGQEEAFGSYLKRFKGKFGPLKDDVLVYINAPLKTTEARNVIVTIENPKSTLKSIIIYLEKQFGHLELNKETGCYEKHINNTSFSVKQGKNSEITLYYWYYKTNKNYKKYLSTYSK